MHDVTSGVKRKHNTTYIASLSYGKDSIAMLEAIEQLGLPLDRIIHAEVWATDNIPADPFQMVEFKKYADKIIKERFSIDVEHVCATCSPEQKYRKTDDNCECRMTYEDKFYTKVKNGKHAGHIYGFPKQVGSWCKKLKINYALDEVVRSARDKGENVVQYLGIASNESIRIARHTQYDIVLPLVKLGWDEDYCMKWCEDNDLLSPVYTTATRGGCWFCHNQGVDQLRVLRREHPELWDILMRWDLDSVTPFHSDGHTVHDFDKRFYMEDNGMINKDGVFRWSYLNEAKEIVPCR